ncbi:MAG: hypothetical protein MUE88_00050 [Flavobacteriales bacterium]|jgi:hypothetical protein|nr:hypothetical protein [Flavobacteriales bacterium]
MPDSEDTSTSTSAAPTANKGERVRSFFNSESKALHALYRNIETLIPSAKKSGAAHTGEEGRYIEALVRSFLNKHLPKELEALSGFILRPAAKVGIADRSRRATEDDAHSSQLDIIVYDSANYPVYERFEEFAIVPPEGVVAIISVKKNLYKAQVAEELSKLSAAALLCRTTTEEGEHRRGPGTSLLSFGNKLDDKKVFKDWVTDMFNFIAAAHKEHFFDQCTGSIICLDSFSVFKRRPNSETEFDNKATYVAFDHHKEDEWHFGLQFLLTGILAGHYHPTRNREKRPGFTSFPSGRSHDLVLGTIDVTSLRFPPTAEGPVTK